MRGSASSVTWKPGVMTCHAITAEPRLHLNPEPRLGFAIPHGHEPLHLFLPLRGTHSETGFRSTAKGRTGRHGLDFVPRISLP